MLHKFNKRAIVVIVAIVAIIAVVGSSFAWFVTRSSLLQNINLAGIDVSADVFFVDGSNTKFSADEFKDKDGLYVLSLDEKDVNYIGNLHVFVGLEGTACVRVRMSHEWTSPDGKVLQRSVNVPYKFGENWFDNRNADYSVYYAGKDMSGKADFDFVSFINGIDETKLDTSDLADGTTVRLLIQVDAVQVNRYPQLWNIEKLPWK